MSEDIRLSSTKVARRCACRGWVIGFESPTPANADVVVHHQETDEHRKWDRAAWIAENTYPKPVRVVTALRKIA